MARFADNPVNVMRNFSAEMVREGDAIIPTLESGQDVHLEPVVKLDLDDGLLAEYEAALDRYRHGR